jgi:hypothetical protein
MAKRLQPRQVRRSAGTTLRVEARRGWPVSIRLKGGPEAVVEVVDFWVVEGGWWHHPQRRIYFRIRTTQQILDVYVSEGRWTLSRVWD